MVFAGTVKVGEVLSELTVQEKGIMVPEYEVKDNKMVFKENGTISYRPWSSRELSGRVRTVYHLPARDGVDRVNRDYIDALIASRLPEGMPDSPYKTITILNLDDALWGTRGIGRGRLEKSQKEFAYACYVADEGGVALKAWGLKKKQSAVIILDARDRVLFFKEGQLTAREIETAVGLIKTALDND